jgi:hypothetical protein
MAPAYRCDPLPRSCTCVRISERDDSRGHRRDIARLGDKPQTLALDLVGEEPAACADDRQRCPDVVKPACADRQLRFDVACGRDNCNIGVQEPVTALLVWDPFVDEEGVFAVEAKLLGQLQSLDALVRGRKVGISVACAHEEQTHIGNGLRCNLRGTQYRLRIVPIGDGSAPEQDVIVGSDSREPYTGSGTALRRRNRWTAELHYGKEVR